MAVGEVRAGRRRARGRLAAAARGDPRRRGRCGAALLGGPGRVYLLVHQRASTAAGPSTRPATTSSAPASSAWSASIPTTSAGRAACIGLLVDREFGLAAWAPAWLLLAPALAALGAAAGRPGRSRWSVPALAGWFVATFVALTMHGWWWPGRQVVVIAPCS